MSPCQLSYTTKIRRVIRLESRQKLSFGKLLLRQTVGKQGSILSRVLIKVQYDWLIASYYQRGVDKIRMDDSDLSTHSD